MPRPRLHTVKGKIVPQFVLRPQELKELRSAQRRKPAPQPRAARVPRAKLPAIAKTDLRLLPPKFTDRDLLLPDQWWKLFFCRPRLRVRKNQRNLSAIEWQRFIHAIEALAETGMPSPTYAEFVQIHIDAMDTPAGMAWGA